MKAPPSWFKHIPKALLGVRFQHMNFRRTQTFKPQQLGSQLPRQELRKDKESIDVHKEQEKKVKLANERGSKVVTRKWEKQFWKCL